MPKLLFAALFAFSVTAAPAWAQPAPPAPPGAEEEAEPAPTEAELAAQRAEEEAEARAERAKLHCSPVLAESCESLDELHSVEAAWTAGVYGSTMCMNSKAIEEARKKRKSKIEFETAIREIAEDEGREMEPFVPFETNREFNNRTTAECVGTLTYYCGEMMKSVEGIAGPDGQLATDIIGFMCNQG